MPNAPSAPGRALPRVASWGVLAAVVALLVWPLWTVGWFESPEGPDYLLRLELLAREVAAQGRLPRWIPELAGGHGYPLYTYYAPGSMLLALPLHVAGLDAATALKVLVALAGLGGAAAMAAAVRRLFGSTGGLLAGALHLASPFWVRSLTADGNLSQVTAHALAPVVLLALVRAVEGRRRRDSGRLSHAPEASSADPGTSPQAGPSGPGPGAMRPGAGGPHGARSPRPPRPDAAWGELAALAAAVGVFATLHTVSTLMDGAALAALGGLVLVHRRAPWRTVAAVGGAAALGLVLSAWFWLPALVQKPLVHSEVLLTGFFDTRRGFVAPDVPGAVLHGAGAALLLAAGAGVAAALRARHGRALTLGAAAVGLGALALGAAATQPVWEALPLLRYVQPNRLAGPATLALALAAGAAGWWWRSRGAGAAPPRRRDVAIGATLALAVAVAGAPDSRHVRELPASEWSAAPFETCGFGEYLPVTVRERPAPGGPAATSPGCATHGPAAERPESPAPRTAAGRPEARQTHVGRDGRSAGGVALSAGPPEPADGETCALEATHGGTTIRARVVSGEPTTVTLRAFDYPGWSVTVDGAAAAHAPDAQGRITVPVPAGAHEVAATLRATPLERAAEATSLAAWAALAALGAWRLARRRLRPAGPAAPPRTSTRPPASAP